MSKQFTALAVLQLEEQGTLSLTDDVRRFVPEMPVQTPPILIRDLLQHTSGLRDYGELEVLIGRRMEDMPGFLDLVARQRTLNFTPGTKHEYSHSDYELLGLIVERASRQPFGQHIEEKVLGPLGMTASRVYDARRPIIPERAYPHLERDEGFQQRFHHDVVIGGGNLYTSVEELARWDKALADGAAGSNPLIARMLVLPTIANGDTIPYAWGIRRDTYRGLPILTRGGNAHGTRTEIIRFPTRHLSVAVLCNGSHLPPGTLGERVADRYLDSVMQPPQAPFAPPPPPVAPRPGELERFAGWYGDLEQLEQFTVVGGKLAERLGDTVQTWTYRGNGHFTADGSPEDFRLTFSEAPMRYVMAWRGEPRYSGARLPDSLVWQPRDAALAAYEGVWINTELDLGWRVVLRDGTLVLTRQGAPDASLLPHRRDRFSVRFGPWNEQLQVDLEFHRNPSGEVIGFVASTSGEPAIRDVHFVRIPSPGATTRTPSGERTDARHDRSPAAH